MFVALALAFCIVLGAQGKECGTSRFGRSSDDFLFRIVGGKNVIKGAWPWQISLRQKSAWGGSQHICGGSILNSRWIVTAAHCVQPKPYASNYLVRVGEHNIQINEGTESDFAVAQVIIHEYYSAQAMNNDIALLKLSQPINLAGDDYVNTVCLPEVTNFEGQMCVATGWGHTRFQGSMPTILQEVSMPVVRHSDCISAYSQVNRVTANMICAGYSQGGMSVCQGDSGGPLVCKVGNKWTLVGVTSWGVGCAAPGYPGVFARVTQYNNWIKSKIAY